MKIAIDISQIAYEGTGVANYTRELVISLLKYDRKNRYLLFGYSLRKKHIIDGFFRSINAVNSGAECRSFLLPQSLANLLWNRWHSFSLESLIGKADIYHSSDWIQIPANAIKVTTVHDLIVYRYPQTSAESIVKTQKMRLRHVKNECQLILVDSYATKKDLVGILDIKPQKIKVVYPGISSVFEKSDKTKIPKILKKYKISTPYIIFIGGHDPRKNLIRVIKAYKKISLPVKLVIVSGFGWGQEIKEEDNIKILHNVEASDLPVLYSRALMLVYPSLYEGFGLPVIEAMKCGCPVITSKEGSLKEVACDSAIFVDPLSVEDIAEKIKLLFNDKKLRDLLIAKGVKNASRFSWKKATSEIIRLYESL